MTVPPRRGRPEDIPALSALAEAAYAPYTARLGGVDPYAMRPDFARHAGAGSLHVVDRGGRPVAFIIAYPQGDALMVENVAVAPAVQGAGIGRALLGWAESDARRHGLARLWLYTNEVMTENQAFYVALGYVETGRRALGRMRVIDYEKWLEGGPDTSAR